MSRVGRVGIAGLLHHITQRGKRRAEVCVSLISPVAVRTERFWKQKLDCIHATPVRKGLVQYPEDGRFSSARYYATSNRAGIDVNITQITW